MKVFIVAFVLGVAQGVILCDWYRTRGDLKLLVSKDVKKAVLKRKSA